MNFSAYSIKNPLVAILLFTLLMIGGIFGFNKMKVQQFPDVTFPVVIVTVPLPGAAPAQLENDIGKKVENKLAGIEGVKTMRTTLQTGAATITTEFELEKDLQEAVDEVRSAINEIKGDLPAAANDPIISKVNMASEPILTYTISSSKMNEMELSWFVNNDIDKRLSEITGVGDVGRIGGVNRVITVAANPNRMNALQMPISQLSQQISATQQDTSGGTAKVGGYAQTIRILGAVENARELGDMQISLPTGGAEPLSNLATITDGEAERASTAELNGNPVVAFTVTRTRLADGVKVAHAVQASLDELQKEDPSLTITEVFNTVKPIEEDYKTSMNMLIEGGALAVIVVFLFLRNWRATIVSAVALPLSVIPAFLGMWYLDFSLNMLSLLALSLVIGVLVDDAIVEVENIVRHLQMGKTPYQAAMEAADEIGLAVIATTFTLIAVFLPTAFMSGIIGQFFKQFGWTAAIAIFMSLLVARLITPMMAAYFMKPIPPKKEKDGFIMSTYLNFVKKAIKHRWLTVFAMVLFFAWSVSLVKHLPSTFIPADEMNQSRVAIELTPDVRLEDTARITSMTYEAIKDIEGIESVMSAVGQAQSQMNEDSTGISSVNTASLDIVLAPRDERPSKAVIEGQIIEALKDIPAARFSVGIATGGGIGYEFQLSGDNPALLEKTAQMLMTQARQLDIVSTVSNNKSLPKAELIINPNRLAMADKGVTTRQIANTLRIATAGDFEQSLSKLNLDSRQINIVVRLPDEARANVSQLADLYVTNNVRVGDVADLSFKSGPSQIRRFNRERSIKFSISSVSGDIGPIKTAVQSLPIMQNLPDGISVNETGEAENQAELLSGFAMAMGIGIFCIFGVLILLFHKVLQPFTILMALPLSIGGAFIGLLVTGSSLSLPSMIGFIMLMGIATKNSILLVDYAIIAQNEYGKNRFDALIDACHKRARPIVMTTIAMGAGMMPLLLGLGGADPTFRQPMAAAVIGGLVTSTALSLIVIPVIYTFMDDLSAFVVKMFKPASR
ncbi:efflux RND transporter permease subunit [Psychrobacter sp. HD31]|uniref:efflux RND transporter permease subunit n=1 Tax=Psychrobacter sp. HD31 TaxID=3112003 RepID=UPI003DA4AB81